MFWFAGFFGGLVLVAWVDLCICGLLSALLASVLLFVWVWCFDCVWLVDLVWLLRVLCCFMLFILLGAGTCAALRYLIAPVCGVLVVVCWCYCVTCCFVCLCLVAVVGLRG